jgi:hypothetical protein
MTTPHFCRESEQSGIPAESIPSNDNREAPGPIDREGASVRLPGRINWVKGTPRESYAEYVLWRDAVESADDGDSNPLIDLLRSDRIPGPEARELFADLLERRPLTRRQGRQKTPAYRTTPAEARLQYGAELYERVRS